MNVLAGSMLAKEQREGKSKGDQEQESLEKT